MLKTIAITIVICLTFHTEYVDVYQHSDYKTVDVYKRQIPAETKTKIDDENNVIGKVDTVDSGQQKNDQPKTDEKINDKKNETITPPIVTNDKINETESFLIKNNTIITHAKVEHNGAIYRSFYVFFGLSVIVLIYISFRTFKMRPGAPAPATVRKYGIIGRRSDMEMQPLPLNEDDDDDTLFDAVRQNQQRS